MPRFESPTPLAATSVAQEVRDICMSLCGLIVDMWGPMCGHKSTWTVLLTNSTLEWNPDFWLFISFGCRVRPGPYDILVKKEARNQPTSQIQSVVLVTNERGSDTEIPGPGLADHFPWRLGLGWQLTLLIWSGIRSDSGWSFSCYGPTNWTPIWPRTLACQCQLSLF